MRLLYTPTLNVWGLVGEKSALIHHDKCVYVRQEVGLLNQVGVFCKVLFYPFMIYVLITNCTIWMTCTFLSNTFNCSIFIFSVLRLNIQWMDLPWAMVPSTSNIGWTGKLLQWVWSISCQPVYLLSTCSTTQILPRCHWAPTLLSGQPSYPFSGIEKQLTMRMDLIFRVCTVLKPWKKLFKDDAKM